MFPPSCLLRQAIAWLLLTAVSGLVPILAAEQPGRLASASINTQAVPSTRYGSVPGIAAIPHTAQQSDPQAISGAAPAPTHHVSKWVWVALVAAAGVGVGVAVIAGNSQSGRAAVTTTTATIGVGTGGVTAGAPH